MFTRKHLLKPWNSFISRKKWSNRKVSNVSFTQEYFFYQLKFNVVTSDIFYLLLCSIELKQTQKELFFLSTYPTRANILWNSFNFMSTKFQGLTTKDMFVYTWIRGFQSIWNITTVNEVYVVILNLWIVLPTKYTIIKCPTTNLKWFHS